MPDRYHSNQEAVSLGRMAAEHGWNQGTQSLPQIPSNTGPLASPGRIDSPLWEFFQQAGAKHIPPGGPGAPIEPFAGFVEPTPKPAANREPESHFLHIPVRVHSDAAALALALQVAMLASGIEGVDHLGATVTRRDGDTLGVFCGSINVNGRRCARTYKHNGACDPDWQEMRPEGGA